MNIVANQSEKVRAKFETILGFDTKDLPTMQSYRIFLRPDAPQKPLAGEPCNGCGVCCLVEPCPVGVLLTLRLCGACSLLCWEDGRYLCRALTRWQAQEGKSQNGYRRFFQALFRRWIAAGTGCDAHLQVEPFPSPPDADTQRDACHE
ncbi:MAG: hypothetical protein LBQ75_02515 [Zoogloeaceae bacterium]|nr:hypothetical protein [Zoogloeaceae bacterium]